MHIEVFLQDARRVGLEIAPVVLVPEPRGRDLRPGRNRTQFPHLPRRERLIERHELIALVPAHRGGATGGVPRTAPGCSAPELWFATSCVRRAVRSALRRAFFA